MSRKNFFPIFILFLFLSLVILFLSNFVLLKNGLSILDAVLLPMQSLGVQSGEHEVTSALTKLKTENERLKQALRNQTNIENENKALKDQFQTTTISSQELLPATIIGYPSFLPGISLPEFYVIDKGEKDGIKKNQAVVVKNNLVGFIEKSESNRARVKLLTENTLAFTGKTEKTQALGVVKGRGNGEIIFDNVVLSEKLEKDDFVVTKGDTDMHGVGIPPDLIVGKIVSIDKKPSALFQVAKVHSLVDFSKTSLVFVVTRF